MAGYLLIYLDLKPYFLIYNHTVFYTTKEDGGMGDRESFTPVGRGPRVAQPARASGFFVSSFTC